MDCNLSKPTCSLVILAVLAGAFILAMSACQKEAPPAADLTPYPLQTPPGLDSDFAKWIPADNPLTVAKVDLGKKLYFDPRLSVDGTVSCATCHNPTFGFSNGVQFSPGHKGQLGDRNSPTVINRLYSTVQFWDGRAASLEEQALGPVQNPVEMANTVEGMIANLEKIPGYKPEFRKAFGTEEISADRVAKAIASFERTLLSANSPFDRFQEGDATAISDSAKRGFAVFIGKGACNQCHPAPHFTDEQFHNIGVGMDKENPDLGRFKVTQQEKDKGAFKTPTLRDITETYPYLHDGSAKTLGEVVEIYDRGGTPNPWLDAKIKPLELTRQEGTDLVEFLKTLTCTPIKIEEPVLPD